MAALTPAELLRMIGMRPQLRAAILPMMQAIENATGKKVRIPPRGGVRSAATQVELWNDRANNRSASGELLPVAMPGNSKHEYGAAVDLDIIGGTKDDYAIMATIVEDTFGFASGWPNDSVHVELIEPLATSKAEWATMQQQRTRTIATIAGAGIAAFALYRAVHIEEE